MLQITFYQDNNSLNLSSKNYPLDNKKASAVLRDWEKEHPTSILKYTKVIE